jgi:EmrB/QacA subfamily drug resistance transporter
VTNHRALLATLSGGFLALLLAALDQAIVTPALPAIARDLHGLDALSWVVTAYLLTSTTMTLVYGKLSDIHGRAAMISFAIVIFVVASLFCALAQNMFELIGARALQGIGAGGLAVMAQAMVGDVVPPHERGRYQSIVSLVFAVATTSGPPLGGFLVGFDWRWCFWINLPLGTLAFVLVRRVARRIPGGHGVHRIDVMGLSLLTGAVAALLLVCSSGGTAYPWLSAPIVLAAGMGIVLLAALAWQQRRSIEPIFPARIFAQHAIRLCDATSLLMAVLQFAGIVLVPVFLQLVMHQSPAQSGLMIIPLLAGTTVGSIASGQVMHATGRHAHLMPIGLTLAGVGYYVLSTVSATTAPGLVALYLGAVGTGIGTCYPIMNTVVTSVVERTDIGVAMSSVMFSRAVGGALGAAVFWSLLLGFVAQDLATASTITLEHAFHAVFLIAAAVAVVAVVVSARLPNGPIALGLQPDQALERAT